MTTLNKQSNESEKLFSLLMENLPSEEQASHFSLSQDTCEALYSQAYHLYENGKYPEAKRLFHFLTIVNPFEKGYWMGLAASYQMLKEYSQAIEFYSIAALQDKIDPYIHLHAADCFFAMEQVKNAFQALNAAEEAAKLSSDNQKIISHLALIRQAWSNGKQNEEVSYG